MRSSFALRQPSALLPRLASCCSGLYAACQRISREEKAITQLKELPDYLLRDLGISPGEIESVVRDGFTDSSPRGRG